MKDVFEHFYHKIKVVTSQIRLAKTHRRFSIQIILSVIVEQSYFVESGLQHSPLGNVVTYQII